MLRKPNYRALVMMLANLPLTERGKRTGILSLPRLENNSCYVTKQKTLISHVASLITHGAEPFLRSRQLCSYYRTFLQFMELGGSLPCSEERSTGPILSQIIQSIPSYLSRIHFNIAHTPVSWCFQWSLSLWLYICLI
jgi:hypothetical protein